VFACLCGCTDADGSLESRSDPQPSSPRIDQPQQPQPQPQPHPEPEPEPEPEPQPQPPQPPPHSPPPLPPEPTCVLPELPPKADGARLSAAWKQLEPGMRAQMSAELAKQNTTVLYNTQLTTANLLIHAEYTRDVETIEALASLYDLAFDALVVRTAALYYYATPPGASAPVRESVWALPKPTRMWTRPATAGFSVGPETVLDVAQFLYAVSRVVRIAAEMPDPPAALVSFTERVVPVILEDHYLRWIDRAPGKPGSFQTRGWDCNGGTYGHREHVENLIDRRYGTAALPTPGGSPPPYCNMLRDVDLWIISGVVEMLAADRLAPERIQMAPDVRDGLTSYVTRGNLLITGRSVQTALDTGTGPTDGKILDPDGMNGHPDGNYSGYTKTSDACANCLTVGSCTCPEFPGWSNVATKTPKVAPVGAQGTGWDISHARRLVSVFDSFRRNRGLVPEVTFTDEDARAFARQMAFAVWNGDMDKPSFATFFSGANGWFRVNYAARPAFGYPPSSMTSSAPLAGYGFWAELEPALGPPLRAAFGAIDVPGDTSDAQAQRVLQALPSFAPYRVDEDSCGW
jgi:hypothetical protein